MADYSQIADRLYSQRLALIGEAAHVVLGAQGLNMSLADIKCLNDLDQKYLINWDQ